MTISKNIRKVGAESTGTQYLMMVALAMCLVQFSGAWIYPPIRNVGVEMLNTEKTLAVPFQYTLWATITFGLFWHVQKFGFHRFYTSVKVVLPFALVGLVAAVFGINPFGSIRSIVMWVLVIISASIIGSELNVACARRTLCQVLLILMLGSIIMALVFPLIGQQVYGFSFVWRGVFTNKNQLGWMAGLTLIFATTAIDRKTWKLFVLTAFSACVCLVFSSSKGALLAAILTIGYVYTLSWLSPRVSAGFGVFVMSALLLLAMIFAFVLMPYVLEMLGRDATLTGRTDVWSTYFSAIVNTPWLGEGAGAYTSLSPLTLPLANKLASLGIIVTPHNVFLGVLGDTGLFGLVAFICIHIYLTLTRPFLYQSRFVTVCAGVGFMMLAHGLVETHDVLAPGPAWFLLIFAYALSLQEQFGVLEKIGGKRLSRQRALPM